MFFLASAYGDGLWLLVVRKRYYGDTNNSREVFADINEVATMCIIINL